MSVIPVDHDVYTVWVARYRSDRRADTQAFSDAARGKRWIEEQTEQSLAWEQHGEDEWCVVTEYLVYRVRRVTLHDPIVLQRRFEDAFNGEYGDDR